MNSLQVLHLTSEYPPHIAGGLGTHVFELTQGLAKAGCRVTVLAFSPQKSTVLHDLPCAVHFVAPTLDKYQLGQVSRIDQLLAFNREIADYAIQLYAAAGGSPVVIHCHDWYLIHAAKELARLWSVPIVATIHLLEEPPARWWGEEPSVAVIERERELCQTADALITVSESMRTVIRTTHGRLDQPIHVVHNGLDPQLFLRSPLSAPDRLRLRRALAADDEPLLLFAGRLCPQKGIAALIASAAQVLADRQRVRYIFVGEPNSRKFAATINTLLTQHPHVQGQVKLLGKVPRQQLIRLYQVVDVALVPSIYEPFGYAALEAMASGVPVIATAVGGLPEIIEHNQTGLLVPVAKPPNAPHEVDVAYLTDAQHVLLDDPEWARQIGQAGRSRVLASFGLEQMVAGTLHAYRSTIGSN